MIGIVTGLFCTLCVAGLCTYFFKPDLKWYIALDKPYYLASGGWFTVMVAVSYVSSIMTIGRLVEYKHMFPSMIFFVILGICEALFMLLFFTCKEIVGGLVCISCALAMAYVLLIRFLMKDVKVALEFLPTFVFLSYCFMCVLYIAMKNA